MIHLSIFFADPLQALPLTILCSWLLFTVTHWLFTAFPGSFSLGEGAVMGQTVALAVTYSIQGLVSSALWPEKLSEARQISLFIQVHPEMEMINHFRIPVTKK